MALRVTGNLLEALTFVADYRMLSLSQIAYMHFSGKRSARRRIQQLESDGLVTVLPVKPTQRGGRPENVYGLTREGLQVLQSRYRLPDTVVYDQVCGENLVRQAGHQLLLGWCRIHLMHCCCVLPQITFRLLSGNSPFALDAKGCSTVSDEITFEGEMSPVRFTPDATFILTDAERGKSILFFVEVDMGGEPLANGKDGDIREKILRYQQYFRWQGYRRYERVWYVSLRGFRLLFLTVSDVRLRGLCTTVRAISKSDFVWVSTEERMVADGISGTIWARGGHLDVAQESILDRYARSLPLPELSV